MVMYTERNVETVQCMWEEFNNWLCEDDAKAVAIVEGVGTPEVRYVLRSEQIIAACERGWEMFEEHGQQEHMLSYDWTYVPWFCLLYTSPSPRD